MCYKQTALVWSANRQAQTQHQNWWHDISCHQTRNEFINVRVFDHPNLRRGCPYNRTHSHTFPYTNRNMSPFGMGTQQQEPVRFVCCLHSLMLRTHLVSVILFHVCFLLFGPIDPSKSLEASVSVSKAGSHKPQERALRLQKIFPF